MAAGPAETRPQIQQISTPNLNGISAKSFLVFDLATGQNLMEKNGNSKLAIASLTKLVTGLTAYENSDFNKSLLVSSKDIINVRPTLGLKPGDEVNALDVFDSMLVGSCNDAAQALANFTAGQTGKNFVELMNTEAKNLGMNDSEFSNPLGFDSQNNYSTAEDLKILIEAAEKLAVFKNLGRRAAYSFSGGAGKTYYASATNKLLAAHPEIQAIKTGYTQAAGEAMATKVEVGSRQVVIIVLDSLNREADTLRLEQILQNNFSWQ